MCPNRISIDQAIIEGLFEDGAVRRMIWAWGGGWAGEWDRRRRYGFGRRLSFNKTHQPIKWRDCGGESANRPEPPVSGERDPVLSLSTSAIEAPARGADEAT